MSSFAQQVRNAFSFLDDHGYLVVDESDDGMGGGVEYRSADLWIVIHWDRDRQAGLEFASTHRSWYGRVPWDNIDHLLRQVTRFEHEPPLFRSAALEHLATFVRTNLTEIEKRFSDEHRETTAAFLRQLEADRRHRAIEYWDRRAGPNPS